MTTTNEVPVFGRGADHSSTVTFGLEVHDLETGETKDMHFQALRDPGAGPFLAFMRASSRGEEAMVRGAALLIFSAALDTDGLSADYEPPAEGDQDERLGDIERWSSKRRFMHVIESDRWHIGMNAITELAQWLMRRASSRGGEQGPTSLATPPPIGESSPVSSRGRTTTRRGSTASRSKKA